MLNFEVFYLHKIHDFSASDVTHTPVSSVKYEEVSSCNITGLCCSKDGVVFAADKGLKRIYRIELETGNCYSFGKSYLGKLEHRPVKWCTEKNVQLSSSPSSAPAGG
jgi:hypothetical protein